MKTEPNTFSIEDFENAPKQTACWEGVRNYQARNFMRDDMKIGDAVLFYHSNCKIPSIMGLAEVVKESYPDYFAWDKESMYYDSKSTPENPRWFMVDIKWKCTFKSPIGLPEIKEDSILKDMRVAQKGQRLSIQPVLKKEFERVLKLAGI